MEKLEKMAFDWATAPKGQVKIEDEFYCATRDVFEARNDKTPEMLIKQGMEEPLAYLVYSMLGEIGNNSFDHNIANWPDIPGVFFVAKYEDGKGFAIVADRGLGVLATLKKALPELKNDCEALEVAFTKKISGRILENRGNGLKFVRNNVSEKNMFLQFFSGNAEAFLNHTMKINENKELIRGCLAILKF